jgi:sugar/nucleoside kinase (ribokinase family)
LDKISDYANYLILNSYEWEEFMSRIWKTKEELLYIFDKIIVTLSEKGSKILSKEKEIVIPTIKVENIIDPTWAWDAYRAWLIRWLKLWYNWEISAKLWNLMASHCIQFDWWQSHFVSKCSLEEEMKDKFWEKIDLYTEKKTIYNSREII